MMPVHEEQVTTAAPLWEGISRVLAAVMHPGHAGHETSPAPPPAAESFAPLPESWNPLLELQRNFDLSDFELDVLLLCAGAALDPRVSAACMQAQPEPASPWPTFGLALRVLRDPHWSVISRARPLLYWRMVEVGAGPLLQAPLTIDERILQYLLGVPSLDERLEMIVHPLDEASSKYGDEDIAHKEDFVRCALNWHRRGSEREPILLIGGRPNRRKALFAELCRDNGLQAWSLDAAALPESVADRERLARILTREAALQPSAFLIDTVRVDAAPPLETWLERVDAPIGVEVEKGSAAEKLKGLRINIPSIAANEREQIWQQELGPLADLLNGEVSVLADTFELDTDEIEQTARELRDFAMTQTGPKPDELRAAAWRMCRVSSRRSLDDLAVRVEPGIGWKGLVLPQAQIDILRQIINHASKSAVVYRDWGFADRYRSGLGLSALFSGPSGTGKTLAAATLAKELGRDLYQIDLATVVSKYIGETEKHLRRIFDAAERSGAMLLFDEADALFGKRSQVKDSHDRYSNLEISYLLQRMESYQGIAILTTNMQNAIDTAFQRRLRFVVQFPFPDPQSRERIWRGVFPEVAPTRRLDFSKLAQLNVTGGVIRNIALMAAFFAATDKSEITMQHILAAARIEYAKLDRSLMASEIRGWE